MNVPVVLSYLMKAYHIILLVNVKFTVVPDSERNERT